MVPLKPGPMHAGVWPLSAEEMSCSMSSTEKVVININININLSRNIGDMLEQMIYQIPKMYVYEKIR